MLHRRLLLNRSRFGRLRQARRSVAPYAMLRYLLLLANPAQLITINPGKAEQKSRSAIVLGTSEEQPVARDTYPYSGCLLDPDLVFRLILIFRTCSSVMPGLAPGTHERHR